MAYFNSRRLGRLHYISVFNLISDTYTIFLVDTGANVSVVGLNNLIDDEKSQIELKEIFLKQIEEKRILSYPQVLETITKEPLKVFPCKSSGIQIEGSKEIDFFFHIFLGKLSIPLLGNDYLEDCTYHHSIGGEIVFKAVAEEPAKRFYPENVIDFNRVMEEYGAKD